MELPRKVGFADWTLDRSTGELSRNGATVRLQSQPLQILEELLSHAGELVTREQLIARLWPKGIVDFDTGLNTAVRKLRIALADDAETPRYIETIPRRGYRLLCDVTVSIAQSDATLAPASAQTGPAPLGLIDAAQHAAKRKLSRSQLALIVVGALIIATTLGAFVRPTFEERNPIRNASIVVLPFEDLTENKSEQPFSDGLAEELSNWLAQIPTLRVVARSSALAFRDRPMDVREIGKMLNVSHVLQGSLRRRSGQLRISVQLIETTDGVHVWSETYDLTGADIVQIQEQVSRAVATNLELRLTPTVDARFADRHGTNAEAYAAYLLARHHQQQLTREDNERAIELYRTAIAADSGFSLAKVSLAHALLNQRYFANRSIESIAQEAAPLLASVVRTNPDLADLYIARGALATDLNRPAAAIEDLRTALKLNPNSVEAMTELGYFHLLAGEPRAALNFYTQAVGLDPLSFNSHSMRCVALADLARFDDASFACERARALNRSASWPLIVSSSLEEARGNLVEAWRWTVAAARTSPNTVDSFAERGRLLIELGAPLRAREVHDAALAALGPAALDAPALVDVGLTTSFMSAGIRGLEDYIATRGLQDDDDPYTQFRLARGWMLAGRPDRARVHVDAIRRSKEGTSSAYSAWYARTGSSILITLAATLIQTGEPAMAEQYLSQLDTLLTRLEANGVQRSGVFELRAKLDALRGNQDAAMQALKRAAQLGWRGEWHAQRDPCFVSLRERKDFLALTQDIRARNERDVQRLDTHPN